MKVPAFLSSRGIKTVLLLLLVMAGIEITARVHHRFKHGEFMTYLPAHEFDFYRFYRANPNKSDSYITVNSQGFRDTDDLSFHKDGNEFRVFVMGGSTVWGDHAHHPFYGRVTNEETIAHQLETVLNQRLREVQSPIHVRVVNAGLVGYMLYQNLIYFDHVISRYEPDLVISIDGHNDITYKVEDAYLPYRHPNELTYDSLNNEPGVLDLFRMLFRYLEQKSVFFAKFNDAAMQTLRKRALESLTDREPALISSKEAEEWLRDYLWTVERMDASIKLTGADALFMLQPELVIDRKPLTELEQRMKDHWYSSQYPVFERFRPMISESLRETAAEGDLWFEDLQDVFEGVEETTYFDYCHVNPVGAGIIAQRLADLVLPVVLASDEEASLRMESEM